MKPTQEQILQWAREAGYMPDRIKFDVYQYMPIVTLAYEAGRKDENEACAKVCDQIESGKYEDGFPASGMA